TGEDGRRASVTRPRQRQASANPFQVPELRQAPEDGRRQRREEDSLPALSETHARAGDERAEVGSARAASGAAGAARRGAVGSRRSVGARTSVKAAGLGPRRL